MKYLESFNSIYNEFLYFYIFNDRFLNNILNSGKIVPANIHKSTLDNYKGSYDVNFDDDFFKNVYNLFYKKILDNKPYKNFGIFLTTIDLFSFENDIKYRFKIPYNRIRKHDLIIGVNKHYKIVNDWEDIESVSIKFKDVKIIKDLFNKHSVRKFLELPQIIDFSGEISISMEDLEKR